MPYPRPYVTIIRWAEGVFIVFAFAMLSFLPFPPHGAAIVSYVVISVAIVAAGYVWWKLRSPTQLAWRVAAILAGMWSLLRLRNVVGVVRSILGVGAAATHQGLDPVFLVATSMASLPSVAQLVVLCAWVMASRVR